MTIPELITQCKADAEKIQKKFKAVTEVWFKYENIPVSEMVEYKHLSVLPLCKEHGNKIQFQASIMLSNFRSVPIFFYTPEPTETEIVEVLYPVLK